MNCERAEELSRVHKLMWSVYEARKRIWLFVKVLNALTFKKKTKYQETNTQFRLT